MNADGFKARFRLINISLKMGEIFFQKNVYISKNDLQ